MAIRVPVPVGSIADITRVTAQPTSTQEVNDPFRKEATSDRYRGVAEEPLVSTDIIGDPRASVPNPGGSNLFAMALANFPVSPASASTT